MAVKVELVEFSGWKDCVKISNERAALIVTSQVGPRVVFFGTPGGENHMALFPETAGKTGGDEWNIFGGHRLWHSPEMMPRSYAPDNSPIEWREIENGAAFTQPVESSTGIQKEIEITLCPDGANVRLRHRLTNKGLWDVELALWALTVLAPGGMLVAPQTGRDTGLLANRIMVLWPYTRMTDPRVLWGDRYVLLNQDVSAKIPFKIGTSNEDCWSAYFNHNQLFIKSFSYQMGAVYPDGGCNFETYTNERFIEMESLSPVVKLAPGAFEEHLEYWALHDNVARPERNEDAVAAVLTGKVDPV